MNELQQLPEGYLLLAIAVVKRAVKDYQAEYEKYLKTGKKSRKLRQIERWLLYNDGILYSFGKGEVILEIIRKSVVDGTPLELVEDDIDE